MSLHSVEQLQFGELSAVETLLGGGQNLGGAGGEVRNCDRKVPRRAP